MMAVWVLVSMFVVVSSATLDRVLPSNDEMKELAALVVL